MMDGSLWTELRTYYNNLLPLIWLIVVFSASSSSSLDPPLAPALYILGDSTFDSGNNNFLPTLARANFFPYGNKFSKGTTGRFTNGRTVVDFIAEYLRLPYPPPYLSLRLTRDVITGLNFASGSCGILPETGSPYGKCLNLEEQVNLFARVVNNELPGRFNSSSDLRDYLSKAIFAFSTGNNDYITNYLEPGRFNSSRQYSPNAFSKILVGKLSDHLRRVFDLGARKFVVFELGPIGCIPAIARKSSHKGLCVDEPNRLVSIFNYDLGEMLKSMTLKLRGSAFILGKANWLGYDMVVHPSSYGFSDSTNPCCRSLGNGTSGCIPFLPPCRNPDEHLCWDGFHQTEPFYSIIAIRCFNGTSVCTPFNLEELVRK